MNPNFVKAAYFAAVKHTGQMRKGANEPYINHPLQVANFIRQAGIQDPVILCAAALHDTLEDTQTTDQQLQTEFGQEVLKIVQQCSDDKSLGKVQRKIHQIEHAKHVSKKAKIVKLADKLSNLQSINTNPPSGWSAERVKGYLCWGYTVCENMKQTNEYLQNLLNKVFEQAGILNLSSQQRNNTIKDYYQGLNKSKQK